MRSAAILILFGGAAFAAATITVAGRPTSAERLAAVIDAEIDRALVGAGIVPSPRADDAEFLRRVTLDLTGTVPPLDRAKAFLDSDKPDKRSAVIDELLASPEFGRHMAHQWAGLLIKRDFDANKNLRTAPFVDWLAGRINSDAGWDAIVREILTVTGSEEEQPAALFFLANQEMFQPSPAKLAGATANLFMGLPLHCAECHEHPTIPGWTQQDFWGLAAFFGHVRAERDGALPAPKNPNPASIVEVERKSEPRTRLAKKNGDRAIAPGAAIAIPDPTDGSRTIGTAQARFFGGPSPKLRATPFRPALANWLTSTENRYFAPATVNRLWAQMFARGLVHPVEEMHEGNPPSHPAVLNALAELLTESGYDIKTVLRAIALSNAYQRTSRPTEVNADDRTLLSHMPVKVLGARELLSSISVVTGVQEKEPNGGRRPVPSFRRPGPQTLERFFDAREYDDDPTEYAYSVPHLLKQMNSSLTLRSRETAGRLLRANGGDREAALRDLYLTTLSRLPRETERERMRAFLAGNSNATAGLGDVAWALLNSAEFLSNH